MSNRFLEDSALSDPFPRYSSTVLGVPLILYLTIHKESLGAVLVRKRPSDGKECAIYYLSKKFSDSEANYSEVEKTCVALVWVLHGLRQYTLHHQIMLTTECDPIKYLLEKPALVGKLAKWQILISEFDVQTMTQKSVKGRAIADMLAENAAGPQAGDEIDPLDDRVLPVLPKKWVMYFDGAVNLSGSGTGAVLISPDGQHYPVAAKLLFPCTNNIAEYEACILELQAAVEMKIRRSQVYGDFALIILRTEGKWKTRDPKLIPYHEFLEDIIEEFDEIAFEYLPRAQNQFADALATLSSMFQVIAGSDIEPLRIEILKHSAYSMLIEEEVDGEPWYQDIKVYLQTGEFPEASSYANVTKKNVARFLRRDIFARYGAPEAIIIDNGSNLNNKVVDEVLGALHCVSLDLEEPTPEKERPHVCGFLTIPRPLEALKDLAEGQPELVGAQRSSEEGRRPSATTLVLSPDKVLASETVAVAMQT
ncbi:uncharacterized protein LOC125312740 [Rhodamnia argentea]|uniref:Uncharacterized protein LOC125312740 n=1 Tax=Rhodamnia argentea TaxID=178133 RepID=A0ABM3GTZ8_9MYRT|nr:uncharacterized protein LOC125312740 [Rhodamnia argentea]